MICLRMNGDLRLKVKEYQEKGFECLISGKFLNKNSAKICDVEQEATIRELLRKHNNFDNVQVAELYNFFGEKNGLGKNICFNCWKL